MSIETVENFRFSVKRQSMFNHKGLGEIGYD